MQSKPKPISIEDLVAATVASFPPLTDEQADRIAALLRGAKQEARHDPLPKVEGDDLAALREVVGND